MAPADVVDVAEAAALVADGATVLDARGPVAFLRGHVPGAVRVSWRIGTTGGLLSGKMGDPGEAAAAFAALGVDDARPVLVVGDWEAGWGEEGRVAWDLAWLGHPDVNVLRGGMAAWTGPVDHLGDAPRAGRFTPRVRDDLRATREEVAAGDALIVDVRDPDEFAGARKYGEAAGGHVPGAINVPWRDLVGASEPLPRDREILLYCTGGVRSAIAWLWLVESGYSEVKQYDGSWWEWSQAGPIER
ncbi:MAG: sulfurtransferase [Myxococcota bacterium]